MPRNFEDLLKEALEFSSLTDIPKEQVAYIKAIRLIQETFEEMIRPSEGNDRALVEKACLWALGNADSLIPITAMSGDGYPGSEMYRCYEELLAASKRIRPGVATQPGRVK